MFSYASLYFSLAIQTMYKYVYRIWGFHSGGYEEYHLLGYDAGWFAELFFDPEDGGDTFLRNVGYNSTDYPASYPRRWYSSMYK
jgi:hypothetical protein